MCGGPDFSTFDYPRRRNHMSVKVAVVGAGKFGRMHLDAFTQLGYSGTSELAAVAESNPKRAEVLKKEPGLSHIRGLP